MPLFEWSERYSVGVRRFDEQHQQLFGMINSLHDSVRKGQSRPAIEETFRQLVDYTEKHFVEEEKQLRMVAYPFTGYHCSEHDKLRTELKKFQERYETGQDVVAVEVVNFLLRWWTDHILANDRKYRPYVATL
jgi:hemerythrin-like metal-binding protein